MKKFLDEHGLHTYDQKIKEYIGNNAFNPSSMQTVNETVIMNQAQADWNQSDSTAKDFIKNKPTIPASPVQSNWNESDSSSLAYIQNKPTIPAAQIQSDWSQSNSTSVDYIKNKPTLATVATTGSYEDLEDRPCYYDIETILNFSGSSQLKRIINPEQLNSDGNWVDPDDDNPSTNVHPQSWVWGWRNAGDIDPVTGEEYYNTGWDDYAVKEDSIITSDFAGNWSSLSMDYDAGFYVWSTGEQRHCYTDNTHLDFSFLDKPGDLCKYKVRLTCDGVDYLLPIQPCGPCIDGESSADTGYYAGQAQIGQRSDSVPSGNYLDYVTHPFRILFNVYDGDEEVSGVYFYIDSIDNHIISNVALVKENIKQLDSKLVAQSDWEESDTSSAAYIKNKTHWFERQVDAASSRTLTFTKTKEESGDYPSWESDPVAARVDHNYDGLEVSSDRAYEAFTGILPDCQSGNPDFSKDVISEIHIHSDNEEETFDETYTAKPILMGYNDIDRNEWSGAYFIGNYELAKSVRDNNYPYDPQHLVPSPDIDPTQDSWPFGILIFVRYKLDGSSSFSIQEVFINLADDEGTFDFNVDAEVAITFKNVVKEYHPLMENYIPNTIARVSDLTAKVPDAPTTDGTYVLKVTVTSGVPTYSWGNA